MQSRRVWVVLFVSLLCLTFASLALNVSSAAGAPVQVSAAATKTRRPTRGPTTANTRRPTRGPTTANTRRPTRTPQASATPTKKPTRTPSATITNTPTETTVESTATAILTTTPLPSETVTATDTPTPSETAALTDTPTPPETLTPTDTTVPTFTVTDTPNATESPTSSATPLATATSTETATPSPTPTSDDETSEVAVAPGAFNSTFLIANLDTQTADTTLSIFDTNSAQVYNATKAIAPNGAIVMAVPVTLTNGFNGSASVSSAQNIYAVALNNNSSNTARDIYEGTEPNSNSLIVPVFRNLGTKAQKSTLAIQNGDPTSSATVYFHYYNADGSEANGSPLAPVTIPPMASHYFDSQALFGNSTVTYTVSVTGTTTIAGAERLTLRNDTAAVAAVSTFETGTKFYLNQVERNMDASGNALKWSEIYIRNLGTSLANVTTSYYAPDGTFQLKRQNSIPPNGFATIDTRAIVRLGNDFQGYAVVSQAGSQPLAVQWVEANNSGRILYGFTGIAANQAASSWACADTRHFTNDPTQYTSYEVLNVDASSANVILTLYDDKTGAVQATKSYTVPANKNLTIDLSKDAFDGLGKKYQGLALIESTNHQNLVVDAFTGFGTKGVTAYNCANLP